MTSRIAPSLPCGPRSPCCSTSTSTTTRPSALGPRSRRSSRTGCARCRTSCAPRSSSPFSSSSRVPGEHNRRNAAAALAALELAGVPRGEAEAAIVEFRGAGRRLEPKGEAGGVTVLDSYAHHPAELAADLAAVRRRRTAAGALPAAPLLADAPPRARVRRGAGGRGCRLRDRDLPGPRGARCRV